MLVLAEKAQSVQQPQHQKHKPPTAIHSSAVCICAYIYHGCCLRMNDGGPPLFRESKLRFIYAYIRSLCPRKAHFNIYLDTWISCCSVRPSVLPPPLLPASEQPATATQRWGCCSEPQTTADRPYPMSVTYVLLFYTG